MANVGVDVGLNFYVVMTENSSVNPENIRIQSDQINSSSERLSSHLETTRQLIDNYNMQTLGGNTSLRNAVEGPLSQDHGASISTAITTTVQRPSSNEPPSYEDVMQQMAITITIE